MEPDWRSNKEYKDYVFNQTTAGHRVFYNPPTNIVGCSYLFDCLDAINIEAS